MSIRMISRVSAAVVTAVSALTFSTPANAVGFYGEVRNIGTNKCLAVPNSSSANGTGLIQWTCNDNGDQQWLMEKVPGGNNDRYVIYAWPGSKCLAMPNSSTANGTQAIQWTCDPTDSDQIWIQDSWYRLRNLNSDKCLAVPNSSTANGTEVIQWTCNDNLDQRWS
ncbi:ricin-type beta-trefoil lectin domain protein [Streptomyces sp. S3(2020)]|uniref:RICIN domain-containing protein n=1 Tax=Streptomyces sp. S3(2020) TaxID=2732044 RepID=UPI001487D2B2|nr:RICIN domain-containing protein [Streptomyces sp. S3(2020)]NNN34416.1 ricin-type beta-trefoil lectin domain protein [Streptomyces sp. S3(2020)]